MTQLQIIEFAEAALACRRAGLLRVGKQPDTRTSVPGNCVPGRVRHQYKDGIVCAHCGAPKGYISGRAKLPLSPDQTPAPIQVPRDLS